MFLITSVSALARFSSYVLSAFSSSFASSSFLGSARRTRARPRPAASNATIAALYASKILVVLLKFEVIVVQISGSRAYSSRAIANVRCVVISQENGLNLNQPG